jgi:hypothetical protein
MHLFRGFHVTRPMRSCCIIDTYGIFNYMSRSEIALHKKNNVMEGFNNQYVKRTRNDYDMSFKLSVVFRR